MLREVGLPRHAMGRRTKRDPNATVYVLRVALMGQPRVWRRISVSSDQTLDHLHAAIFTAFDRFEEHLYSFFIPRTGSRRKVRLNQGVEYTSPAMIEEAERYGSELVHDASLTAIGSLNLSAGHKLAYLFDFGDGWGHDITVECTDGVPVEKRYPRIIEKFNPSPPQYTYDEEDWDEDSNSGPT